MADHFTSAEQWPCILYEATPSLEITQISVSAKDSFGIDKCQLSGGERFWKTLVYEEDWGFVENKLRELQELDSISFMHRVLNQAGLPIWVAHCVKSDIGKDRTVLRGCISPISNDKRLYNLNQTLVTRFIHKLGNHFQLLNLVFASMRKTLPESRDTEVILDTLDKAAEMTRAFAESIQIPSCPSEIQIAEVLKTVIESKRALLDDKGISLEENYAESVDRVRLQGDLTQLEAALDHVFTDLADSADPGSSIRIAASLATHPLEAVVAKFEFVLRPNAAASKGQHQIEPRKEHDSLRMTLAAHLIEMHGGLVRISKKEIHERMVEISLPVRFSQSEL